MRIRRTAVRSAGLSLTLLLLAVPTHVAHAQFGGLVRRAKDKVEQTAKDRAGATDSAATARAGRAAPVPESVRPAAEPASPLGPYVKEFTPDMLDHALTALDAEQRQAARMRRRQTNQLASQHGNPEMDAYQVCFNKALGEYQGDMKKIQKKCGTVQDAQAKSEARVKGEKDAEHADSVALQVPLNAAPDSAGAVAGGFGSQRKWGTVKERITAFLLLDANGAIGQCMKAQRLQYIFTDPELELLRSRRADLSKRFLDKELIKDAVWGRCSKAA